MTDDTTKKQKDLCKTLYGLLALSAFMQFSEQTLLIGLIAMITTLWIASKKRKTSAGTIFQSHYQWMQRTFWIGTGVIIPIAVVISTVLIICFTDILQALSNISSGVVSMNQIDQYMNERMGKISLYISVTTIPTLIWWVRRCWNGFKLLKEDKPVEKVMSWL